MEFYISDGYKDYRKNFTNTPEFAVEYDRKLADSLKAITLIGNSYTASVWLGVTSHFETRKEDLTGKRVGIGSYGSGSSAIVCSFKVQPEYKQILDKIRLLHKLNKRQKIPFDIYEDLHEGKRKLDESVIPPKEEFALNSIGVTENDVGYRYYKYVE